MLISNKINIIYDSCTFRLVGRLFVATGLSSSLYIKACVQCISRFANQMYNSDWSDLTIKFNN